MAGGGIGDFLGTLGSGLTGLAQGAGGAGGSGSSGMPDLGSNQPQADTGNVLTNPLIASQEAVSGADPSITGGQQGQQQPPPQQPPQQPTFTPPPQQAQGQTQPVQYLPAGAMDPSQAAQAAVADPNQAAQATVADPNQAQAITATVAGGATTAPAAPATDQSGGQTDQQGNQQDSQQKQGGQQRQQNPLTQAGNILKNIAKPHSAPAPSLLASLLNRGPGGLLQDLMGLTNQAGPAYGPQEYGSQGATEHGYGYGAGEPPAQAAAMPPTPQQPPAPQPPTTGLTQAAQAAAQNPAAAAQAETAAVGTAPVQAPGAQAPGVQAPGAQAPGVQAPGAQAAQPTSAQAAPGVGANPAADRWVSPQHVARGQLAGTDTPPTSGYSTTMRDVRAPVFEKLSPQDKILAAGMMQAENATDPIGPMESLANRAAANNMTMGQLLRSRFYGPGASFARRGMAIQRSGQMPHYEAVMDAVRSGSNVLGGATDQGSGRDPNVGWSGGRVRRSGEVYNDWGGGRGHAGNAAWRRNVQARVRAENQQPVATAQRAGGASDLEGIVNTTARLAPGGLPTQDWRQSSNIEEARGNPFMTPLTYPQNDRPGERRIANNLYDQAVTEQQQALLGGSTNPMSQQLGFGDIDTLLNQLAQQWAMSGQVPMPRPRPRM